jgi:hypothetical protein
MVAHACNPSYSGGRDQEGCSFKPAWANSLRNPISKTPITKKKKKKGAGGKAQGIGLSSNPSAAKNGKWHC